MTRISRKIIFKLREKKDPEILLCIHQIKEKILQKEEKHSWMKNFSKFLNLKKTICLLANL